MMKKTDGFTLIELVITVAIVAILSAIALPNYRNYLIRTNRNVAKADLAELQQWMERNYTLTNRYDQLPAATTITASSLPFIISPRSGTKKYDITFSAGPTETTYTLKATPTANQNDAKCGFLAITNAAVRTIGGTGTETECWDQ